ncbi:methyltransferase [Naumannella cuiyingiana]|uniref:class I SAM-dependent methyltransferase n=1 Tax=Naumannella cuiyingiana TaxID=1347891 RepID=UPI0015CA3B0D
MAAVDPVDALIMDEAGPAGRTLAIDAPALPADRYRADRAETPGAGLLTRADLVSIDTVLLRLPRALSALDELAERIAAWGEPGVRVVAGGRVKHMTHGMNEVLARHFGEVRASRGRQKARVLHASDPHRPAALSWPRSRRDDDLDLTVVAHGATFGTNRLDAGTRLLAGALELAPGERRPAVDLGCGSGILAALLARRGYTVTGLDVSAAACASTAATAAANRLAVRVLHADAADGLRVGQAAVIVCNPPFHVGAAKDSSPAFAMFDAAGAGLAPGGEFWCVFNSHLPYLPALRRAIGPTGIVARDRAYTVTRSVRA